MKKRLHPALLAVIGLGLAAGCDPEPTEKEKHDAAIKNAKAHAKETMDKARAQLDAASEKARKSQEQAAAVAAKAKAGADKARSWASDLTSTGELSATAKAWLAAASTKGASIEGVVVKGKQLAPVAVEIGRALRDAVDNDTAFEPIYQKIEPGDDGAGNAAVDKAIKEMGRVEVIDGVSVGFKELTSMTTGARVTEKGYLVLWRRGDHLIGFVYRSRNEIDINKLVTDAPKLVGLVEQGAKVIKE